MTRKQYFAEASMVLDGTQCLDCLTMVTWGKCHVQGVWFYFTVKADFGRKGKLETLNTNELFMTLL